MMNYLYITPILKFTTCLFHQVPSSILVSVIWVSYAAASHAIDPPDLSALSESQKEQGFGQLQTPAPEPTPSEKEREKPKRDCYPNYVLGAGAGAAGGVIAGEGFRRNRFGAPNDYRSDSQTELHSGLTQVPEEPTWDPADESTEQTPPARMLNFDGTPKLPKVKVDVHALFARDLARFDAPIVDGINNEQLGWSGASGIDASLRLQFPNPSDGGYHVGFALIGGDDEARTTSAQRLYTTPSIGFSPSPFVSLRDMSLATVEGNLLSPASPWGQVAIGMRWLNVTDSLENQVIPNGLYQHIQTSSNSFMVQLMIEPKIEFKRVRFESLFQIGAGPVFSNSSTEFRNLVGGPAGLPNVIELDRVTGAVFLKGKLGLAIPIRRWLAVQSGVELLTQSDIAPAAAQLSHTDLAQQRFHLRTESMVVGSLFVGLEVCR
jgi:hypothetical protein